MFAKLIVTAIVTVGTALGSIAGTVSSDLAGDPRVPGGLPEPGGPAPSVAGLPGAHVAAVPDLDDDGATAGLRHEDDGCSAHVTMRESDESAADPDAFVDCDLSREGVEADADAYGGHDDGLGGDGGYGGPEAAGYSLDRSTKKWVGWEDAFPE